MTAEDLDFEESFDSEATPGEGSGSGADGDGRGKGGDGKAGDGKDGKGGKDKAGADEVKLSRKDHDALLKQLEELKSSERYWADKAKADGAGGKTGKGGKTDEDDDDAEPAEIDPAKLIDELGSKGIKALRERGLITAKEAKELIRKEAAKIAGDLVAEAIGKERKHMAVDAELTRKFPDLADANSELFRRTAQVMKEEFGDDREMLRNPKALMSAARTAAAELKAERGESRRGKGGEDDQDEAERLERVRRQSGDRGRRGTGFDDQDGEGALTPIQREVAKRMGVSEETYKKHRDAMAGERRRR